MMWVVILVLMTMELMDVTCNTLGKAAMAKGLNSIIFTTYTHGIGFFFLIPFAFIYHRKTSIPPITLSIILRLCLLGAICGSSSMFLFIGVRYSSPTLASSMNNLAPALTFIVAIISRMEILNLKAQSSMFKLVGTLVSITGAFIVTFYKGLPIILFPESPTESSLTLKNLLLLIQTDEPDWVLGGFFCAASSIFLSVSYVVKTWIARDFPSEVIISIIFFFFETIIAGLVNLTIEGPNPSVWLPTKSIVWIAIMFGAFEVAVVNTVQTWACGKKGPLFVAMFKPFQMILAVIMGISFLGDVLHLGSVIGGMVIAVGFYTVMKGKAEEETRKAGIEENGLIYDSGNNLDHKIPLLKDKSLEV